MTPWIIAILIVLLLGGVVAMLLKTVPIAKRVHRQMLVRTEPEKWGRVCSAPEHPEQSAMWEAGCAWAEQYAACMQQVQVENDGLKLFGEYYDFGADRCAVILPGRCECLKYSYYFAEPYRKAGCNVLVIDARCHGKSDGVYCTIGKKESEDLRVWVRLLTETFHNRSIILHGICVGSPTGLLLMEREDCPKEISAMVLEGCFTNFRETFKQHMLADHRPLFPVLDLVMLEIYRHTGTNVLASSPLRSVKKIRKPMLFLCGKEDIFSLPEKSRRLFEACAASKKELVWFEKGSHSHLRLNNPEQYDNSIGAFLHHVP